LTPEIARKNTDAIENDRKKHTHLRI